MNLTVDVPVGSSSHGSPHLVCSPPQWYDYIVFFGANYFAHAATVIRTPGQGTLETVSVMVTALVLPISGVTRAMAAIRRHAATVGSKEPLKQAARAGALCMVARSEEPGSPAADADVDVEPGQVTTTASANEASAGEVTTPNPATASLEEAKLQVDSQPASEPGNVQPGKTTPPRDSVDAWWNPLGRRGDKYPRIPPGTQVCGEYHLVPGYRLVPLPPDAPISELSSGSASDGSAFELTQPLLLPSSYNLPKILVSFVQAVWACITLYRARGDQIAQYGYAAFGLTVTQYAFMSVANLAGSLLTPDYATMFLVRTPLMDAAEAAGCFFTGELRVEVGDGHRLPGRAGGRAIRALWRRASVYGFLAGLVPLLVVAALSGFQAGNSTPVQGGFTMAWLVVSTVYGSFVQYLYWTDVDSDEDARDAFFGTLGVATVFGAPAIGGMVIVALMIRDFGICTYFG